MMALQPRSLKPLKVIGPQIVIRLFGCQNCAIVAAIFTFPTKGKSFRGFL
jgi:hypothetical protein